MVHTCDFIGSCVVVIDICDMRNSCSVIDICVVIELNYHSYLSRDM